MTKYLLLSLLFAISMQPAIGSAQLPEERQQELKHMLLHDCGSCHGMTLNGGLGPALTAEALTAKPEDYLFVTVRDGHPGTPMPPWSAILSEEEIAWIVSYLKSGEAQQ